MTEQGYIRVVNLYTQNDALQKKVVLLRTKLDSTIFVTQSQTAEINIQKKRAKRYKNISLFLFVLSIVSLF